jgi:hypothetical protein
VKFQRQGSSHNLKAVMPPPDQWKAAYLGSCYVRGLSSSCVAILYALIGKPILVDKINALSADGKTDRT